MKDFVTTHMPLLHQHPDSLWWDKRSPPDPQLGPDLSQQIQNCVAELPVLQLNPVVFSRHSDTGKPDEDISKRACESLKKSDDNTLLLPFVVNFFSINNQHKSIVYMPKVAQPAIKTNVWLKYKHYYEEENTVPFHQNIKTATLQKRCAVAMTDFSSLLTVFWITSRHFSRKTIYSNILCLIHWCPHMYQNLEMYSHLLFSSSILSVGTIMFPYSSMFWKDWKVFTCCGISSRQTCRSIYVCAYCVFIYIYIYIYGLDSIYFNVLEHFSW